MSALPTDLRHEGAALRAQALALNAEVSALTSPLDAAGLDRLLEGAIAAPALLEDGRLAGFLVGYAEGAAYDSPNYRWFAARLPRFAYVDRVIVAPWAQRRGIAARLYESFAQTRPGVPLVCEVNILPPNPGSDAFHAALGFEEMGQADLGPGKRVRYLCRSA